MTASRPSTGGSLRAARRKEGAGRRRAALENLAESADVLTGPHQRVILPDLNAGCSMADMADIDQVEECWEALAAVTDIDKVVPITYMNSSAALKAFVGEHGGAVCTSSNARAVLDWALAKGSPGEIKVLFFPDQHLGRNTGFAMGYTEADMAVWDPRHDLGGLEERDVKAATFLLWRSVLSRPVTQSNPTHRGEAHAGERCPWGDFRGGSPCATSSVNRTRLLV